MKVFFVGDFLSSNHVHLEPSAVSKCPLRWVLVFESTDTAVARMVKSMAVNHWLLTCDILNDVSAVAVKSDNLTVNFLGGLIPSYVHN